MKGRLLTIACLLLTMISWSQQKKMIDQGNQAFRAGNFAQADSLYRISSTLEDARSDLSAIAKFNEGDALFRQEQFEEAAQAFGDAAASSQDHSLRSRSFHNLGNSLLKQEKPQAAIDAYKEALRLNPDADDTRYNLSYAMQMLQEQEQKDQGNNEQDNQQQQEQKERGPNDQEQQGEGENENEGQQDDQSKNDQGKQSDQRQNDEGEQEAMQPYQLSKDEAERMLEALNQREREIQQQLKKQKDGKRKKTDKDW